MTIRWRLAVAAAQLLVLVGGVWLLFDGLPVGSAWFQSGLLAIVVNRQLLEPFYSRPADVLVNSVVALVVWMTAERIQVPIGWDLLLAFLLLSGALALVAMILGAGRTGWGAGLGRASALACRKLTAQVIYSAVFWVALLEDEPATDRDFWVVAAIWFVTISLGSLPLQRMWGGLRLNGEPTSVVGLVGPARLLVTAPTVPDVGSTIRVDGLGEIADAVVVSRIRRASDLWAELQVSDSDAAERLFAAGAIAMSKVGTDDSFIGVVEEGSTVDRLVFASALDLLVGDVVSVDIGPGPVLFQVTDAQLERRNVKGGSEIVTRTGANQLGRFDLETGRIVRHPWIARPGSFVREPVGDFGDGVPAGLYRLGCILNTNIPIYVDIAVLCEGHAAVLGMTKMGKTTLARRMASAVAERRRTIVIDGTGEYRTKLEVQPFDKDAPWTEASLSVLEPPDDAVGADYALKCVDKLLGLAGDEYDAGTPVPRSLLFEEAHDYFPEPASLGFNTPGRDSSFNLGLRMMKVRKYGLSFVLVSQRTAVVSKSALSQCENLIVFRSVDRTGLDYLEEVSGGNIRKLMPSLKQGQAVVFGPALSVDAPVAIDVDLA